MWIHCNARLIYADIYPDQVVREEGKPIVYLGFAFSRGWFTAFLKQKNISLRVHLVPPLAYHFTNRL
jgi:hypothetical protein